MTGLDARMQEAAATRDGPALIGLCEAAAEGSSRAFWLTQAWVYALEAGDARAGPIGDELRRLGAA